jgi:hypothetical protein
LLDPVEKIMSRLFTAALVLLGFIANSSSAVDIKNIRPCYGPLGPTRYDAKCLPRDGLCITYEIEGLALDPKTKKASYETTLELLDSNKNVLFKKLTPAEAIPHLGGTSMPGDLYLTLGDKQAPGKYKIRLTINDKVGKDRKGFDYEFEVVPETFGFVRVATMAVGFPGQYHVPEFALANFTLDAKMKQANAEVTIRILDEKGTPVSEPVKMLLPRDMPEGTDLEKLNFVLLPYPPVYLNRAGRFTVEVQATDKNGNKKAELRYPLTVLDISKFTK